MGYKAFDLTGKVALITGGNGGIGLGMADAIAQSGGTVVIWGTNEEKNARAADQLSLHGGEVRVRRVDVADEAAVSAGMVEIVETFGRIDAVFANAGIGGGAALTDMSVELLRKVASVNFEGVFFTLREAARHMIARAKEGDVGGSITIVSSIAATQGAPFNQAYSSTKGAALSLAKSSALELAPHGVRVNAILPGWTATDMTAGAQKSDFFAKRIIPRIPAKRWGTPEDFGGIAVYLTSDASAYHSGDSIIIDGAWALS